MIFKKCAKGMPCQWGLAVLLGAMIIAFGILTLREPKGQEKVNEILQKIVPPAAVASSFGTYQETPVTAVPNVDAYKVEKNLANVVNKDDLMLSQGMKSSLEKNGFVIQTDLSAFQEFFPIYEANRYASLGNFVTTDSILHNYHLMFDFLLRKLEEEKLAVELKSLNARMLSSVLSQYEDLKGTEWERAAKRNVGFFTVGSKLLDSSVNIPNVAEKAVQQEFALIAAHEGISPSPLMNFPDEGGDYKEDYSQYIPRGHYEKSELLKAYFKSMMWYGRLTFRFKNEDEIKSALLTTLALEDASTRKSWDTLYEPTSFFVGRSDDITYTQMRSLILKVYGKIPDLKDMVRDPQQLASLVKAAQDLEPPQINSLPIDQASFKPDRIKEVKGFRFMGQRFTIDAAIFQRLITREVGPKGEACSKAPFDGGRMLPKSLDIAAAFGSKEAAQILQDDGEFEYACYPENMGKLKASFEKFDVKTWTQNLYWGWLYALLPLTQDKGAGYPWFMKGNAWTRKELNTFLGSWTELKHDTILYAKQVYAELGGGPGEIPKDDRGYVEPNPVVYARLASLLKLTQEGLDSRGLLSAANKENLGKMSELALSLQSISEKEFQNITLSDDEYELIRSYGGQLEHFWQDMNREEMEAKNLDARNFLDQNPAAIVADVATDPNGQVLEEATGFISEIYVIVPVDGKLKIVRGGVFSYYEFPWPMSDRLTDTKWRELLNMKQAPSAPEWTNVFLGE